MRAAVIFGWGLLLLAGQVRAESAGLLARGQPVVDPEAVTGVWAAPDGLGGWVEIRVQIAATLPLEGSLAAGPFLLAQVSLGVCHGRALAMSSGECNYFMDGPDGRVRLGQRSLQLHYVASGNSPGVEVNLVRDGGVWVGTLQQGAWAGRVRLERGAAGGLTGSWSGDGCLHIGEWPAGLVGSLDQLQDPATIRYANGLRAHPLFESFGTFVGAERNSAGFLSFEIGGADEGAAGGMVRTIRVRPRVCRCGQRRELVLTGMQSGDGRSREPNWLRVRGNSCR